MRIFISVSSIIILYLTILFLTYYKQETNKYAYIENIYPNYSSNYKAYYGEPECEKWQKRWPRCITYGCCGK